MVVMFSSIIYCIIFLGVYTWAQISTRCKEFLSKNINSVNSCLILLFFILRAVSDSLFYLVIQNDPSINLNGSLLAQITNFVSSIFSRAKCFLLYWLVSLIEDVKIKIKSDEVYIKKNKWERRKKVCFYAYFTASALAVICAVLYFTEYKGNATFILELVAKSVILAIDIYFSVIVIRLLKLLGKDYYVADNNIKRQCCFTFTEK